jgi:hypothetical protein
VLAATYTLDVTTSAKDLGGNPIATEWTAAFSVRDGAWSNAATVPSANPMGGDARKPCLGMDGDGNAIVAWSENDPYGTSTGYPDAVQYKRGTGWQPVQRINTAFPQDLNSGMSLAVAPNGHALWVWNLVNQNQYRAQSSMFDGQTWQAPRPIDVTRTQAMGLVAAMDSSDRGVVMGAAPSTSGVAGFDLYTVTGTLALGWGQMQPISPPWTAPGGAQQGDMVVNGAGSGMLVGASWTSTTQDLWFSRYSAGASPAFTTPAVLPYGDDSALYGAGVAADGSGFALWYKITNGYLKTNTFTAAGVWGASANVTDPNPPNKVLTPGLAVGVAGDAVVTWTQWNSTSSAMELRASRYDSATGWAPYYTVASEAGWSQFGAAGGTVLDAAGNGHVLWAPPIGLVPVEIARYTGGQWAAAQTVDATADTNSGAQLVGSANGDAMLLWSVCTSTCALWYRVFE